MDLRYIGAGGGLTNLGVRLDVGDERKHDVKTPWFLLVLFTGMELEGGGDLLLEGKNSILATLSLRHLSQVEKMSRREWYSSLE